MKKVRLGSWLTIGNISIAELVADFNFDWLCIDMEHSVINLEIAQKMIIAIQSKGKKAFVRVGENNKRIIKRVLDIGVDGIIVPNVNSFTEAQNAVKYSKYPPIGERGVGLARAQSYGFNFENYKNTKAKNIEIIIQIEHINAINDLDKIMQVEGIDGTLIGPYDLSGSLGKPGKWNDLDVKKALDTYYKTVKKYDKLIGFHVIEPDFNVVNEKINDGCNFIAFSLDTVLLGNKIKEELNKIDS